VRKLRRGRKGYAGDERILGGTEAASSALGCEAGVSVLGCTMR